MLRLSLLTLVLSGLTLPAFAADTPERRCGWYEHPPGNITLTDRDGAWTIGTQGGYQAKGERPRFSDAEWVNTNGEYGYGCGCVTAIADRGGKRLDNLTKVAAKPLAACRTDKALQEPSSTPDNTPAGAQDTKQYHADGFSFSYPKSWKVGKNQDCLTLDRPKTKVKTNEEYTLSLCIKHGTLQEAADSMVFSLENGVWMRSAGMSAPSPVDMIEGPGWKGMQTTQVCGVGDEETGFHAAGGECLMAIVYNDDTQLLFDTVGYYQDFDVIDAIIRSVRFDTP